MLPILFGVTNLNAQTVEADARKVLEKYRSSIVVVTVNGKLKATGSGTALPENEQMRRTLGVTIRDNGLLVVSNVAIDASVGLKGQRAKASSTSDKIVTIDSASTEFTKVEISYGDKAVITGKVVRQDEDSDIAFILPDKGSAAAVGKTEFDFVDLSKFAVTANVADRVVSISRSSAVFGFTSTVFLGRITGVYKGDRTFYITTAGNSQGVPVFTPQGDPVGITVVRFVDGKPTGVLGTISAGSIHMMANLAMDAAGG